MAVKKKTKKKATKKNVTNESTIKNIVLADSEDGLIHDGIRREIEEVVVTVYGRRDLRKAERGEFRGDFTRDTFDPNNKFSRVLLQQGRVQLDADWNEQTSINLHHLRSLACDIGSDHWGPNVGSGFELEKADEEENGLYISRGNYYVNGILCEVGFDENDEPFTYVNQPFYTVPSDEMPDKLKIAFERDKKNILLYLDVWERHYNYINDDSIREVALGGPDTATRAKVIWQVKALPINNIEWNPELIHPLKANYQHFLHEISSVISHGSGKLCAKVKDKSGDNDPCLIAPESRYRGAENQLYRVEIHRSGVSEQVARKTGESMATFKWSRENSSVIFPITEITGDLVSLEHLGKDCRYGLKPNDWVEIVDDDLVLQSRSEYLVQVDFVDEEHRQIRLKDLPESMTGTDATKHPYLRRWDHIEGDKDGIPVREIVEGKPWMDLEDGIQVNFSAKKQKAVEEDKLEDKIEENFRRSDVPEASYYQTGDYWLIPARTITGDIEWPSDNKNKPECVSPNGVVHHYAPLFIFGENQNEQDFSVDLRRILKQAWE